MGERVAVRWNADERVPRFEPHQLTTKAPVESVWCTRDGTLYATWERGAAKGEQRWLQFIRVYTADGICVGEHQLGEMGTSAPSVEEETFAVAHVTDDGKVFIGTPGADGGYVFRRRGKLPTRNLVAMFSVCLWASPQTLYVTGSNHMVYRVSLLTDWTCETGTGQLLGLCKGEPVLWRGGVCQYTSADGDLIRRPLQPRGPYWGYRLFRCSPRVDYAAYSIPGYGPGFRLMVVDFASGQRSVWTELGPVVTIGSWWEAEEPSIPNSTGSRN
jgi:hypothetical protein